MVGFPLDTESYPSLFKVGERWLGSIGDGVAVDSTMVAGNLENIYSSTSTSEIYHKDESEVERSHSSVR